MLTHERSSVSLRSAQGDWYGESSDVHRSLNPQLQSRMRKICFSLERMSPAASGDELAEALLAIALN